MKRGLWALAAVLMALLGGWLLSGIDSAIAQAGLFPKAAGGPGLESVIAAVLLTIAGARAGLKSWMSILSAAGLAVLGLWGTRYLVAISGPPEGYTALWVWMVASASLGVAASHLRPGRIRDLGIQLGLVVVAAAIADALVGSLGIDQAVMNKVLYYQTVEIEVHTPVEDPELLYALQPGASLGGEGPWGLRMVRVNTHGARSPGYTTAKPQGRQRTLVFGGSTLYGAGVSNGDTTPGAMDRMLGPNHEVWNFGVCAYNTTQSARLAERMLATLDPDRIIIMITNTGRRAFMGGPEHMGSDKSRYFDENPDLYLENFPPMLGQPEGAHQLLLSHSALYRTWEGWARASQDPDTTYADAADRRAVASLEQVAQSAGVEVLYVLSPSRGSEVSAADFGIDADRWLDLNIPGRSGEYQEAHPPPKVLYEYATSIVRWLKKRAAATGSVGKEG